jgi:diguanylate cyclase (GGDEF)-like protein
VAGVSASRLLSLQAFTVQLEVDVQRAHRYGRALSVALIGVDAVRGLGARRGTALREGILGAVGDSIAAGVRGSDLACRTVGGEFAVLFAETRAEQAARATQRVVLELDEIDAAGVRDVSATAAVAELAAHEDPESLLDRAREALASTHAREGERIAIAPAPPATDEAHRRPSRPPAGGLERERG